MFAKIDMHETLRPILKAVFRIEERVLYPLHRDLRRGKGLFLLSQKALDRAFRRQLTKIIGRVDAKTRKCFAISLFEEMRPADWRSPWVQRWRDYLIDSLLGVKLNRESGKRMNCYDREMAYYGAPHEDGLSPYAVLTAVAQEIDLTGAKVFVDLGSGMGRVGYFLGLNHPSVRFFGFEIVAERVEEANRVAREMELSSVKFIRQDLSDETLKMPTADYYYMANSLSVTTWNNVASTLKNSSTDFKLIVTHPWNRLIANEPWLKVHSSPRRARFTVYEYVSA